MASPNFSLYGPTPSAAAAQQMPWAGFYTEQNNLNERARAAAVLQAIQLQEQQDRQDEEARRYDQARELNFAAMNREAAERAAVLGDRRATRSEDMRRFNINLGLNREGSVEDRRRFDTGTALKLFEIQSRQPSSATVKADENEIRRLEDMADRGEINDIRHVLSLSPTTPPALARQLATTSAETRRAIEAQDAQVKAAIDTVNQFGKLNQELQEATKVPKRWIPDRLLPGAPDADRQAKIDALTKQIVAIAPTYQQIINPKHPLYEDVQLYRSTGIPPRPWQRGRAQTGAASPVNFQNFSTAPAVSAPPPAASRQYPPAFYDRVNQLIDSGMEPRAAKSKALSELAR